MFWIPTRTCRWLEALLILAAAPTGGFCGDVGASGASYAFESLRRPATASEAVSGGWLGADAGPEAIRDNPATLASVRSLTLGASHQTWQSDLQEQWAGGAFPIPWGGASVEVSAFHAGTMEAFSADGAPLGDFRPVEMLAGIGFGLNVGPSLRAGLSAHGLYLSGQDDALTGASVGAGIQWDLAGITLGLAARNLGPGPSGDHGVYRLPAEVCLSACSASERRASVGLGLVSDREGTLRGDLASRVRMRGGIALLAGVRYADAEGATSIRGSAGIEFQLGAVGVAYAVTSGDEIGPAQIVSIRFTRDVLHPAVAASSAPAPRAAGAIPTARAAALSAAPVTSPVVPPAPATYAAWGGSHRSPRSAAAEVRALRAQKVDRAEVVAQDDGTYRVRAARGLSLDEAKRLAARIGAAIELE